MLNLDFYLIIKGKLESIFLGPGIFVFFLAYILIAKRKQGPKSNKTIYNTGLAGFIVILTLTTPPLLEIVSIPIFWLTPKITIPNADAIVVLGGGIKNRGFPSISSVDRTYMGANLFLEGKAPLIILTSGYTNPLIMKSEASAMQIIAKGMGVPESKIILEEKSYNTHTNAIETKKLLTENNINSIILVTSYYHLYRAQLTFKKQGIKVFPYFENKKPELGWPSWERAQEVKQVFHEYVAIMLYKFKGWI